MGEGAGRVLLIFNKGLGPLCFQLVIGLSPQLPNLLQDNVETYVDPCPTHFHPPTVFTSLPRPHCLCGMSPPNFVSRGEEVHMENVWKPFVSGLNPLKSGSEDRRVPPT